jgi:hypothetical protein
VIITSEPDGENGNPPHENGGKLRPVIAGFDTAITFQKPEPEPEPVEKNSEPVLVASRKTREESWQAVCVPDRKTTRRKPSGPKRKKPAKTR